jgi:hypothetical protein
MMMIILQPIENACPFLPPIKARKAKPHRKGGKSTEKRRTRRADGGRTEKKKDVRKEVVKNVVDEVVKMMP